MMPNSCSEVNDCYLHMRDSRYSIHIVEIDLADYLVWQVFSDLCVCVCDIVFVCKIIKSFFN